MRIGFLAPLKPPDHPHPSGDRRMARLLMAACIEAGHEVTLLSRFRSYEGEGDEARQRALALKAEQETARILAAPEARPDLVFTYHNYHKAPDHIGPRLAAQWRVPYVIAEPSVAPKRADGPFGFAYDAANRAIAAADRLLCLTRHDMALVARFAADPARVQFLPPFLDTSPYVVAAPDRATLAARLAVPARPCWLLAVGMMRPGAKAQSYAQLAEALALTKEANWHLLVAGDGEARSEVQQALAPLGGRVSYLGALDETDLVALMRRADVMVWPAVDEAYGMALLEAQCAGLAVLSVAHRGVPDVVCNPGGAVLLASWDAPACAGAIDQLVADPGLRQRLGTRACQWAMAERSLDGAAQRLDAALRFDR